MTEEHKRKIGLANKGFNRSEEVRKKMSESAKKRSVASELKRIKAVRLSLKSPAIRKQMSIRMLGDKNPMKRIEVREKVAKSMTGKISPQRGKPQSTQRGKKHWNWQGGINPINDSIRKSLEYKLWRRAVFERDNYTCIWCGIRGKELNADHIQLWKDYPELRFAIDNGRTLCVECHKSRHSKMI